MAIKDNIDFSTFSDPLAAFDLFSNSIRRSFTYDSYGNKTRFTAVVLSNPIPISPADLQYFKVDAKVPSDKKVSKFVYRARILGENSPHQFLPNPCDTTYASDVDAALQIVAMHTLFVSTVEEGVGKSLPRLNSTVEVELTKNAFSYNLQYGKHLSVVDNPSGPSASTADCDKISEIMANADSATPLSTFPQTEINVAIEEFFAALKPFMDQNIQKTYTITSRARTTEEGRKMIFRIAKAAGVSSKYNNQESFAKDPTEVERVRSVLRGSPYNKKIARPENSRHNPSNGIIAFDTQAPGQPAPSYKSIVEGIKKFMNSDESQNLGYSFYSKRPYVEEPTNGNAKCGTAKCGVVHINIVKKDVSPSVSTTGTEDDVDSEVS